MDELEAKRDGNVIIEYENLDLPPSYVEAAQGMPSPQGVLHVSFYSERIGGREKLEGHAEFNDSARGGGIGIGVGDSFGIDDGNIRLIRRVEANLVFTPTALRKLIPWLQQQLKNFPTPGDEQ